MTEAPRHDPYAALRSRDYLLYMGGRMFAVIGGQMAGVAVGWELYERTHRALSLGWVGLVQAAPVILLALPAGHLADRYDRRRIVMLGDAGIALCALGLFLLSWKQGPVGLYYLCLLLMATVGAFSGPARSSLLPQLVPESVFANAVTWNSSIFQVNSMIGPALGGGLIGLFKVAWPVYLAQACCSLFAVMTTSRVITRFSGRKRAERATLRTLLAGLKFVWDTRIILATITLDLFAVLFGGATALMPVYAKDILHVGPVGLGWMQAAPSAGAFLMALVLAHRPPLRKAGVSMLIAVAGFGAATIVFGISRSMPQSLAMLFLTGAADNVSVVVRSTLVQVLSPDEMRGRVSAVNNVFISSSNNIGSFESGLVAQLFGAVASVVSGGIGTIVVVLAIAAIFPEARRFGSLEKGGA